MELLSWAQGISMTVWYFRPLKKRHAQLLDRCRSSGKRRPSGQRLLVVESSDWPSPTVKGAPFNGFELFREREMNPFFSSK